MDGIWEEISLFQRYRHPIGHRFLIFMSKALKRLEPLDLINVMLGALLGAIMSNLQVFHPTDFGGILNCVGYICVIVLYAINCQLTVTAISKRKADHAIFFFASFFCLELFLILSQGHISVATNGTFSFQFDIKNGASFWVLAIILAAIYTANLLIAKYGSTLRRSKT